MSHATAVAATGVEEQHVTIGAATGHPGVHHGTGMLEVATTVTECAASRPPGRRNPAVTGWRPAIGGALSSHELQRSDV
jgi:hypothetical protein